MHLGKKNHFREDFVSDPRCFQRRSVCPDLRVSHFVSQIVSILQDIERYLFCPNPKDRFSCRVIRFRRWNYMHRHWTSFVFFGLFSVINPVILYRLFWIPFLFSGPVGLRHLRWSRMTDSVSYPPYRLACLMVESEGLSHPPSRLSVDLFPMVLVFLS